MKADLDTYLEQAQVDGLLVMGPAIQNPNLTYFTGPAHPSDAYLARRRGSPPRLYCYAMEREEAAGTGLPTEVLEWHSLMKEASGDPFEAAALALERILRDHDLTGRIFVCGNADVGETMEIFRRLQSRLPSLDPVGLESSKSPVLRARATKGDEELARIRRTGEITVGVVGSTADFLTSHEVRDGLLVKSDGKPLLVGDVKRRINLWLAERGLENPEATIFAIGRDAGIPHSAGQDDQPVPIGQPIVFDIFPCEAGGGYFYDFTRTWCLGHASDEVLAIHQDVAEAYRLSLGQAQASADCREMQRAVCAFFESRGHPSVLNQPETKEGYVHSLGHGLGLAVHEPPSFRLTTAEPDRLEVGNVITIEPGLYYPERNLGVRLEDTTVIGRDGAEVLASYPMDLVLPMQGKARGKASESPKSKKAGVP